MKLAGAALAAAAVAAGSAGAAAPPSGICRTLVKGPTVTFYSCGSATKYLRRFVGRQSPGLQARISGGPARFACISLAPTGYTLFQGACKAKANPKIGFVWTLAFG